MKSIYKASTFAAILAAGTTSLLADTVESTEESAFKKIESSIPGKFSLNYRIRYEEFQNASTDTAGVSHRVRYGYTTDNYGGFTAMIEGETLSRIGDDADEIHPLDNAGDGTDLNQAWLKYADKDLGMIKVGRQIYTLDDQRFIGAVGWRQNIQTFDAATVEFSGVDALSVKAFYLDSVERVTLASNPLESYGLNVSYKFSPSAALTAFYYDIENDDAAAWNSTTLGLRYVGSTKLEDLAFAYSASYATQSDVDSGEEGDYYAADVSGSFSGVTLGAGFEILEAGFRTPLATVHKFGGFADVFLPITGFAGDFHDYYAYVGYKIPVGSGIATKLIYHNFDTKDGFAADGDELDFVASYKLSKYATLLTKYGRYEPDSGAYGKRMFTFELNFIY